jgi:hypothetical protein
VTEHTLWIMKLVQFKASLLFKKHKGPRMFTKVQVYSKDITCIGQWLQASTEKSLSQDAEKQK